jgi:beta-lactamase class A
VYSLDLVDDSDDSIYQQIGKKMSIRELVYQMITVSSNLATNILIDLVGAENVMNTMQEIEANHIQVLRGVEDNQAYERGLNNTTDAYDMLLVMKAIALKKVVTPEACDEMITILSDQKFNSKIPALLPDSIKVAHKTGSITAINHDAAIVYPQPDHPYVLVVLTKGIEDRKHAEELIAKISKVIFDAYFRL